MTVTSSYSLYVFYHHLSIDTKQILAKNGWMSFPSLAFCFVFPCVVTSCLHMWRRCTGTVCGTSRMTPTCCVECGSTGWATTKPSRWTPTSTSRTRSVQTANQMPPPGQGQYKQTIKCHLEDKVSTNRQSNATSWTSINTNSQSNDTEGRASALITTIQLSSISDTGSDSTRTYKHQIIHIFWALLHFHKNDAV